ncbi:MAG: M3 family oligoendopeptidase [Candidatus Micrarchaeota archaeon]|nr:M3 family oligoendopeptidase [Candidatus Micrarchaeota archaeon]
MAAKHGNEKGRWNLSEMYSGPKDPAIHKDLGAAKVEAKAFRKKYYGRIKGFGPKELLEAIKDYEELSDKWENAMEYAGLAYQADMTTPEIQALNDKSSKIGTEIGSDLAFFQLEVSSLVAADPKIIASQVVKTYKHLLERYARSEPHKLSEVEEQLTIEKDQFGVDAWSELQKKWLNTRTMTVEVLGKRRTMPYSEANTFRMHPDRATRASAVKSIYTTLDKDGEIFASAVRNICNDWIKVCERRKYKTPMGASLLVNDTEQTVIDNLVDAIERNSDLYQRYMRLKAKILGLPKLAFHDVTAPIPGGKKEGHTYDEAKKLVIKAYEKFDMDYSHAVKDMFKREHIDVFPRLGKSNGGFCSGWYNGKSAFILMNYNGSLEDIYTLAHELGHATHDYYSQRAQPPMNLGIALTVAETASIFGELLMTDTLLAEAKSKEERISILCHVLDSAGNAAFSVTARYWLENGMYDCIKRGEYLNYETICKLWEGSRARIYGGSVDWPREACAQWTISPHYFMPNFRFYNYPYVYAQMFVYALYEIYLREGKRFVPKLKEALSAGASLSPAEIGRIFGLDVTDRKFWEIGLNRYRVFLEELEELIN